MIFAEINDEECVKERRPHSKAKIQLEQHYTAISAIAKLLFKKPQNLKSTLRIRFLES